ncbi:DUF5615 family PIN-like protein [Dehalococcoidia bacterium]|nr:DUF5615 family PIN-like protein [Dehalococcoidia bacterium]
MRLSEKLKLLADENVPRPLVHLLRSRDIDTRWVREIERGMSDEAVVSLSADEGRVILTLDKDFGKLCVQAEDEVPRSYTDKGSG